MEGKDKFGGGESPLNKVIARVNPARVCTRGERLELLGGLDRPALCDELGHQLWDRALLELQRPGGLVGPVGLVGVLLAGDLLNGLREDVRELVEQREVVVESGGAQARAPGLEELALRGAVPPADELLGDARLRAQVREARGQGAAAAEENRVHLEGSVHRGPRTYRVQVHEVLRVSGGFAGPSEVLARELLRGVGRKG